VAGVGLEDAASTFCTWTASARSMSFVKHLQTGLPTIVTQAQMHAHKNMWRNVLHAVWGIQGRGLRERKRRVCDLWCWGKLRATRSMWWWHGTAILHVNLWPQFRTSGDRRGRQRRLRSRDAPV